MTAVFSGRVAVVFSAPHVLGGFGPSRPLTQIHEALGRRFGADYVPISAGDFPELQDSARLGDGRGPAYDDLAAERILSNHLTNGAPHTFVGAGAFLNQAKFLRQRNLSQEPVKIVSTWFSSHHGWAQKVLAEEYAQWRIQREPIHPYLRWRAQREQEMSDVMVVPSDFCQSTYPKELQDRIRVVGFGVDSDAFSPPEGGRPEHDGHDGPLRLLFPATNPPRKGMRAVLEALHLLKGKGAASPRIIVTGGSQSKDFGDLPTHIAGRLEFPGWLDDRAMLAEYQRADALLLPSLEEGQALAALEGAACGLPLIVTPNVGFPLLPEEYVAELANGGDLYTMWGAAVGPNDPKSLARVFEYLRDSDAVRRGMGRAARSLAVERPWSKFQEGIVRVVEEATA